MLNALRWIAPLPIFFVSISPVTANTDVPLSRFSYPVVSSPVHNIPVCYMEMETGAIIDLTHLCGELPTKYPGDRSPSRPVRAREFQQTTNTGEPCYFIDSNGLPCSLYGNGK